VDIDGTSVALRQVPAGVKNPNAMLLLSAGCAIDERVLLGEVQRLGLARERIVIDPRAVLIEEEDREAEEEATERIASTGSGTGSALIRRMARKPSVRLAYHSEELQSVVRIESVAPLLHTHLDQGGEVIVEGTQGFGLSLFHGQQYPYVTARDTTAGAFISEVGLSPRQVDAIILVLRTFPIRVGGTSGPLKAELTWEDIQRISGAPQAFPEYTSVTKRLRRVGEFDLASVKRACIYNRPTELAVMGLDRLDYRNHRADHASKLMEKAACFLATLEQETGVRVEWVGTGFGTEDAFHMRQQKGQDKLRRTPASV
jgi:adenylosuccinate synthase